MRLVGPSGPSDARIMLVGEAPGREEQDAANRGDPLAAPFIGAAGDELTRMLHDAGIIRTECFLTNVARVRPPDNDIGAFFLDKRQTQPGPELQLGLDLLRKEITNVRPNIIIALGNVPLWALCGRAGISSWRGSILPNSLVPNGPKVFATYHPAAILRQWSWRWITVEDFRRAKREAAFPEFRFPEYRFLTRPAYSQVIRTLDALAQSLVEPQQFAVDLETRGGQIACLGIGWSKLEALCIPFQCLERDGSYWSEEEEVEVVWRLKHLLQHPHAHCVFQNGIYDLQYFARQWGWTPRVEMDTMLAHHVCFPGLPKGLDFLSSMYCDFYQYWKDEGKEWDARLPEDQLWQYNCKDCINTWECAQALKDVISALGLRDQYATQMALFEPVLRMMLRGVRASEETRAELTRSMTSHIDERLKFIEFVCDYSLNPKSPKQMADFFYRQMCVPPIYAKRKKGMKERSVTCDDAALETIARQHAFLRPLIGAIQEYRTLSVNFANVVAKPADSDGRVRCSYNIAGTVEFRFSSSESAFGTGTNLQNITTGERSDSGLKMPNLRRLLIPDPGFTMLEGDLQRADLMVLVWIIDDADLKRALILGVDTHCMAAADIFGIRGIPVEELVESHPNYREHRGKIGEAKRYYAKQGTHAVNYACQAPKLAKTINITTHEADKFIRNWFAAHPGIPRWHERVRDQLASSRTIRNAFGYRRFFFDRIDEILPEALAWEPASTVAIVTNKGLLRVEAQLPDAQLLLQVHDSLVAQIPTERLAAIAPHFHQCMLIPIPFDDPLTIPVSLKASDVSWGDVKSYKIQNVF